MVFFDPNPGPQKAKAMAVPKRRISRSRKGKRRSHHHITPTQVQYCANCEQPVLPHHVCPNCGHYQGREAVPMEEEEK
jgi:large subunit ribosomal protein L32